MELKEALSALEADEGFGSWKEKNNDAYFSHAFRMFQDERTDWQLGFYQCGNEKITTFVVKPGGVEIRGEEEVFKREDSSIGKVELPENALEVNDILSKASQFQQRTYPRDKSMKIITLLQNLPPYGSVWNITSVTQQFNALNMKIHPSSGEILDHKMSSIFSFRQK